MESMQGVITALITPFHEGKLDEEGFRKNIKHQLSHGVNGILVLGTTGESCTLSLDEKKRVIEIARDEVKGKAHLMVGTGTNSTASTIEMTARAKELGADSALIVTPYYNCPTQEGIYQHFEAISNATNFPLVVYNIQKRCGVNITVETLQRLAELKNVVAVKEASGNFSQMMQVVEKLPNCKVFSGDDGFALPLIAMGGAGVISVMSNVVPDRMVALYNLLLEGNLSAARALHYKLAPLCRALFLESNPIPVKAAMDHLGFAAGRCRPPLYSLSEENRETLTEALRGY